MTEKELRKLNRYQLLDLLVTQTERANELQKKVEELEERLRERDLNLSKLGSIAEAAIHVAGVFEASQQAADLYLETAKKQADETLAYARRRAASIIIEAETKARCSSDIQMEDQNETTGEQIVT